MEYDPVAPLALPLGPRSAGMRAQLAAEVHFVVFLSVFGLPSLIALVCEGVHVHLAVLTCYRAPYLLLILSLAACVTPLTCFYWHFFFPVCSRSWRIRWTSRHWRRSRPATCSCCRCPPISSKKFYVICCLLLSCSCSFECETSLLVSLSVISYAMKLDKILIPSIVMLVFLQGLRR